jgi:hypothetical protein
MVRTVEVENHRDPHFAETSKRSGECGDSRVEFSPGPALARFLGLSPLR